MTEKLKNLVKGNIKKNKTSLVLPEQISPEFKERLEILQDIDSAIPRKKNDVIKGYLFKGKLSHLISTYDLVYESAIKKCNKVNKMNLPLDIQEKYQRLYKRFENEMWKIFRGQ